MFKAIFDILAGINKRDLLVSLAVNVVIGFAVISVFSHGLLEAVVVSCLMTCSAYLVTAIFKFLNKPKKSKTMSFMSGLMTSGVKQ